MLKMNNERVSLDAREVIPPLSLPNFFACVYVNPSLAFLKNDIKLFCPIKLELFDNGFYLIIYHFYRLNRRFRATIQKLDANSKCPMHVRTDISGEHQRGLNITMKAASLAIFYFFPVKIRNSSSNAIFKN